MRVLRKYVFVALLSARSNVVYLAEVLSRVVFLGLILYIFSQLWKHVFVTNGPGELGGLTLAQMIWYLTITEAIALSAPRVSFNVDADVRSGAIISYLQRPLSYPLYSLANTLGERAVRFAMNLLVGAVVAFLLVGPPNLSLQGLAFFAVVVPLSFVVDFLACFLIGIAAFWMEDTSGLFLIYSRLNMILGGMLFPLSLVPEPARQILECLPFAAILYGPAKMFVSPDSHEFVSIVSKQLGGLCVYAFLVWFSYGQASKRVFVNGG